MGEIDATNPFWQSKGTTDETSVAALKESMRAVYNSCSSGGGPPSAAIMGGATLNSLSGTNDYIADRWYSVTDDGITLIDD